MTVAEVQSGDDLPEELPGLFGSQPALLNQVVKQLSSWHMLQNQVPVSIQVQQWKTFTLHVISLQLWPLNTHMKSREVSDAVVQYSFKEDEN